MGNLIKTQSTSQIGSARASKKVNNCTLEELKEKLKYIFKLIGLVKSPDKVEKDILIDFILNDMKQFRIEEFPLAFKMLVRGDFTIENDHFQNFSVKYLCSVMNAYAECEKRKKHFQDEKLKELPMSAKLSDSEKQKIVDEGIKQAYEKYKKTGILQKPCAWIFTELENKGRIMLSKEEKMNFYSMAQEENKKRLEVKKSTSNYFEMKEIHKELENADPNKLKNLARELALKAYWDKQI